MMKKLILLLFSVLVFGACKTGEKKSIQQERYPKALTEVFKAHGGLDSWNAMKTLSFNKGDEVHTIDLKTRKTLVSSPKYSIGFDGDTVWLSEKEKGSYKGNPAFYHNLFFYFYAMPFVLADDGIRYEKSKPLTFNGVEYPGIKISYKANIGSSPDDNYILYYNSKTYQMEWLAYTVTFKSKEPSDKFNIIRYNDWIINNGLLLPNSITWYQKDENGNPTQPRGNAVEFRLPLLSKTVLEDGFFMEPKD